MVGVYKHCVKRNATELARSVHIKAVKTPRHGKRLGDPSSAEINRPARAKTKIPSAPSKACYQLIEQNIAIDPNRPRNPRYQ